jgi:PKD repeat protein
VILQVTDDDNLTASDTATARIGDLSLPPTADANGPYNGRVGVALTFDGSGSSDPDGDIVQYDWDFGDGSTAIDGGPTPVNNYAAGGKYIVRLTVTDDSGETDVDVTTATVGIGNLPPQADAGDSVSGKVRRDITFDGAGSSDPDGNIVSYAWEFGDGNTGNGPNPTHRYADAGKYLVTLTVTDNDGATSSDATLADAEQGSGGGGGDGTCFINNIMGQ